MLKTHTLISCLLLTTSSPLSISMQLPPPPSPHSKETPKVQIRDLAPDGTLLPPTWVDKIQLTDAQWKQKLSPEAYRILRTHGTERPFCGGLLNNKSPGIYRCAGCQLPLFRSTAKFDSGTGWPSFYEPIAKENITEIEDHSHGMIRTEIRCTRCDGHLGHVFPDGPKPTGLRYCLNSAALTFTPSSLNIPPTINPPHPLKE